MGRTGTLWAHEQVPVVPDVMTAAKALGGGLPVGACVTAPGVGEGLTLGEHGSTFAGGPMGAAAALAPSTCSPTRSCWPRCELRASTSPSASARSRGWPRYAGEG